MKIRNKLILALITLIVVIFSTFLVYAHLTDTKEKDSINFEYGDINYSIVGNLKENYIYPGENIIITPYAIINNSTIETEIRLRIRFYFNEGWKTISDLQEYVEEEGLSLSENWTLEEGLYYYSGVVTPEVTEIIFLEKLIFDGKKVKNPFESTDFKIELTLHAKQKDHAEWSDLGSKLI